MWLLLLLPHVVFSVLNAPLPPLPFAETESRLVEDNSIGEGSGEELFELNQSTSTLTPPAETFAQETLKKRGPPAIIPEEFRTQISNDLVDKIPSSTTERSPTTIEITIEKATTEGTTTETTEQTSTSIASTTESKVPVEISTIQPSSIEPETESTLPREIPTIQPSTLEITTTTPIPTTSTASSTIQPTTTSTLITTTTRQTTPPTTTIPVVTTRSLVIPVVTEEPRVTIPLPPEIDAKEPTLILRTPPPFISPPIPSAPPTFTPSEPPTTTTEVTTEATTTELTTTTEMTAIPVETSTTRLSTTSIQRKSFRRHRKRLRRPQIQLKSSKFSEETPSTTVQTTTEKIEVPVNPIDEMTPSLIRTTTDIPDEPSLASSDIIEQPKRLLKLKKVKSTSFEHKSNEQIFFRGRLRHRPRPKFRNQHRLSTFRKLKIHRIHEDHLKSGDVLSDPIPTRTSSTTSAIHSKRRKRPLQKRRRLLGFSRSKNTASIS